MFCWLKNSKLYCCLCHRSKCRCHHCSHSNTKQLSCLELLPSAPQQWALFPSHLDLPLLLWYTNLHPPRPLGFFCACMLLSFARSKLLHCIRQCTCVVASAVVVSHLFTHDFREVVPPIWVKCKHRQRKISIRGSNMSV